MLEERNDAIFLRLICALYFNSFSITAILSSFFELGMTLSSG
jgi:hypothetical protein